MSIVPTCSNEIAIQIRDRLTALDAAGQFRCIVDRRVHPKDYFDFLKASGDSLGYCLFYRTVRASGRSDLQVGVEAKLAIAKGDVETYKKLLFEPWWAEPVSEDCNEWEHFSITPPPHLHCGVGLYPQPGAGTGCGRVEQVLALADRLKANLSFFELEPRGYFSGFTQGEVLAGDVLVGATRDGFYLGRKSGERNGSSISNFLDEQSWRRPNLTTAADVILIWARLFERVERMLSTIREPGHRHRLFATIQFLRDLRSPLTWQGPQLERLDAVCCELIAAAPLWATNASPEQNTANVPLGIAHHTNASQSNQLLQKRNRFSAGEDFTWIIWAGHRYVFSKGNQAESVRCLWESWQRSGFTDGCGLSEKTIGAKIGAAGDNFRLQSVFRDHPAFNNLIRRVQPGVYALYRLESQDNLTS